MNANAPLTLTRATAHPKSLINLNGGNDRRIRQAVLRKQITAGTLNVRDILTGTSGLEGDDLGHIEADTVGRLLGAQHYWGQVHTDALLSPRHIREDKRIRELTTRQRDELAEALGTVERERERNRRRNAAYLQRRAQVTT